MIRLSTQAAVGRDAVHVLNQFIESEAVKQQCIVDDIEANQSEVGNSMKHVAITGSTA